MDTISNPRSYGTFHLQMVDLGLWTGRYTSTVTTPQGPDGLYARLMSFPLDWSRRRPEESELHRRDLHMPPR